MTVIFGNFDQKMFKTVKLSKLLDFIAKLFDFITKLLDFIAKLLDFILK